MLWHLCPLLLAAAQWQHPAGMVTGETLTEVRSKIESRPWARELYDQVKRGAAAWRDIPFEDLRRVFPVKRGNVYHNYSCPQDRVRLEFGPFNPGPFRCPACKSVFDPHSDAGIYAKDDRYHGDMYDGWACLFYQAACDAAADLALIGVLDNDPVCIGRCVELFRLFAETIRKLPIDLPDSISKEDPGRHQYARILTYHREGDNKILYDLARAYELVRGRMTPEDCAQVEKDILKRLLEDLMLEPTYIYDHNNVYQWHRTILQAAVALEREDLVDWSFGFGDYAPEKLPEHRSLRRIIATHFKPDGAFWELCSGYHLYPMNHFCELAVFSRNLSGMDPARFPPERYDFTRAESEGGKVIRAALEWFMAIAMPDRTMTVVGDSPVPRAGMDDYAMTAEVGYRFYDIWAAGDYERLRSGKRSLWGLLYGAPEITRHETPFTSSYVSSGWVSLRNEWRGNRVWVGLNALIPGGGHQHADRLTLTLFSYGKLLALEKGTPYNESATRTLGTLSPSHNTVTVDRTSQKQGEASTPEETPQVTFFYAGSLVKFAEAHADHIYPQAKVYRRSVALIEDVVVDLFRVEGGHAHDWMVHHAGTGPQLTVPTEPGVFEPSEWLTNGTNTVLHAATDEQWSAQWLVDGVTSRLTMLPGPRTHVYALETYPVDNAVITSEDPPCRTLCVRRENDSPFLAVWDAWTDAPNLKAASRSTGGSLGLMLTTRENRYYLVFGPGAARFEDGVGIDNDGTFALVKGRDALCLVGGTRLQFVASSGSFGVQLDRCATVSAIRAGDTWATETAADIHYDTYGGKDHVRKPPETTVTLRPYPWQ